MIVLLILSATGMMVLVNNLRLSEELVSEILYVTESAAIAAHKHVGSGDREAVDGAAVKAMRLAFDRVNIDGVVVVGEGVKDNAPMLFAGERLGTGSGPELDIAVDPVDGTRLAAENWPDSVAVLSVANSGAFFDPGPVFYMEKLICRGSTAKLSLELPLAENLARLAGALNRPLDSLRVAVQSRPRNQKYRDSVATAGAVIVDFQDGDVAPAIRAAHPEGDIDLLVGIGGAPEGILTSAAVRSLGGFMQARLAPQKKDEIAAAAAEKYSTDRILSLDDLVAGDGYLFLTAVTNGFVLRGVVGDNAGWTTDSWIVDPHNGVVRATRRHNTVDGDRALPAERK